MEFPSDKSNYSINSTWQRMTFQPTVVSIPQDVQVVLTLYPFSNFYFDLKALIIGVLSCQKQ